jgi:DNA-binding NarL/FixJ family response regulator
MKRFLIADDHEPVRSGLRAVLEQRVDCEVVAEASDGGRAVAAAIENRPHVAIVDFSMPRMTGVEVARRIREYPLQTEVLIFTVHNSSLLAEKLLHDYQVTKQSKPDMVLTSREQSVVQLIAEGHTNRSISTVLKLSVKTVETHRASAMRKLRMSSTAELVRYAIRKRLVAP